MQRTPLLGDRIRISTAFTWAKGVTATVMGGLQGDCMKFSRVIYTSDSKQVFYFVAFDQPQVDELGDGPYVGAEIESRFIELLPAG